MKRIGAVAIAISGLILSLGHARADAIEDFYKGRQMKIIVGTAAGQEYDQWARLLARHLVRYIPGKPSIIVEDMPGAGHLKATNYLFNGAPKDGSVLGMVSRNVTDSAVLKLSTVRFEPDKFNWIGSTEINWRALMVRSGAGVSKASDLYDHEIIVGGTGAGQGVTSAPTMLKNLLGLKLKVVEGYQGPGDIWLAMERGEVDAVIQTVGTLNNARRDPINRGTVKVLFTLEHGKVPGIDAPTVFDLAKTEEQKQVLSFFAMAPELGRPVMAPPGVPAERVEALRRAFDATMKDKEFMAEVEKLGFDLAPQTGEQIAKRIEAAMSLPPNVVAKAQEMYSLK